VSPEGARRRYRSIKIVCARDRRPETDALIKYFQTGAGPCSALMVGFEGGRAAIGGERSDWFQREWNVGGICGWHGGVRHSRKKPKRKERKTTKTRPISTAGAKEGTLFRSWPVAGNHHGEKGRSRWGSGLLEIQGRFSRARKRRFNNVKGGLESLETVGLTTQMAECIVFLGSRQ